MEITATRIGSGHLLVAKHLELVFCRKKLDVIQHSANKIRSYFAICNKYANLDEASKKAAIEEMKKTISLAKNTPNFLT